MDQKYIIHSFGEERVDGSRFTINLVHTGCEFVELIDSIQNPSQTIAKVSRTYKGILSSLPASQEDVDLYLSDQMRTKLTTPLEMFYVVFLIHNVSRAFTHQLVRTRLASYAQESMRFYGAQDEYNVLQPFMKDGLSMEMYKHRVRDSIIAYERMIAMGESSEDARGVLPTNILTKIFMGASIKTLQHIYEQRMCCQAQQGEWQPVLRQMKALLINKFGEDIGNLLSAPYERGEPCGYRASYDRPCAWTKKP